MYCIAFSRETSGGGRNQNVQVFGHDDKRMQQKPAPAMVVEYCLLEQVRGLGDLEATAPLRRN
jgi:hypothetical protein